MNKAGSWHLKGVKATCVCKTMCWSHTSRDSIFRNRNQNSCFSVVLSVPTTLKMILLNQWYSSRIFQGMRLQELRQWWDRCFCTTFVVQSRHTVRSSEFSMLTKDEASVGATQGSFCWLLQLHHCSATTGSFCCCSRFAVLQIHPQTRPPRCYCLRVACMVAGYGWINFI